MISTNHVCGNVAFFRSKVITGLTRRIEHPLETTGGKSRETPPYSYRQRQLLTCVLCQADFAKAVP